MGVNLPDMHLGRIGWGITIGWALWSVMLPLIIEIVTEVIESLHKTKTFQIEENNSKKNELIAYYLEDFRNKVILFLITIINIFLLVSLKMIV